MSSTGFTPSTSFVSAFNKRGQQHRLDVFLRHENMDNVDEFGWTVGHYACFYDQPHVVEALIKGGANLNAKSSKEQHYLGANSTMLHVACRKGHIGKAMSLLINAGADRHLLNEDGLSARHVGDPETKVWFDTHARSHQARVGVLDKSSRKWREEFERHSDESNALSVVV
jgi:ankyrin repeat protein